MALSPRVLATAAACAGLAALAACGSAVPISGLATATPCATAQTAPATDSFAEAVTLTKAPSGLQSGDVTVGCGPLLKAGAFATVHYTAWFPGGKEFDTSHGRAPLTFQTGPNSRLIPGLADGLLGMHVGGKRRLVIPPAMAFGAQGRPPVIPPNATLVFDIELVSVQ